MVLAGSMGFGTVEHWCQMRGHTKTLLVATRTCADACPSDKTESPVSGQTQVAKLPCCKTTVSYEHLDVSRAVADQQSVPAWHSAEPADVVAFTFLALTLLPVASVQPNLSPADEPLSRSGRFRLTSHCTWLI